ncbi:MAG: hypothetical protein JWQ98_1377 [Chlorobi bacterium]|nr:hypothetical protein [Chlorobiota bacterium]
MNASSERLYQLLPAIHRQRDEMEGFPLRSLLRVIAEQVDVVEGDIARLYENWFIETCQEWAVPYIGDLIGYQLPQPAGDPSTAEGSTLNRLSIPRREIANTIRYRRSKGTLALLELLAGDVASWPSRAVEFYKLLGVAQGIDHLHMERGRTADLRRGDALDRLNGPFDEIAHTVDVRGIGSHRGRGRHNIPSVGLFAWRLRSYPVTRTPAYCMEEIGPHCFTFSVLSNDTQLLARAEREADPSSIAGELNVPAPIRRHALEIDRESYYGAGKSIQIWTDSPRQLIPSERIVVADLSGWTYVPHRNQVAVDPKLGRIVFPPRQLPKSGVWVSYQYGFSADMGGGEYRRTLRQPASCTVYRVGEREELRRINDALDHWRSAKPRHAVIELTDSGVYVEPIYIDLAAHQTLQIRAANRTRPVLRLLDWQTERPDAMSISGLKGSSLTIDGLLVTGRGLEVQGDIAELTIRHCTLVPGWGIHNDCRPRRPAEPSLELINTSVRVTVERSIIGSIQVTEDEVRDDPSIIHVGDSIVDATSAEREAISGPAGQIAHATLTIARSTVIGTITTHGIELAEDSIFTGGVKVARRQAGCVRFCWVPPGSRTPRRYNCQPDLVDGAVIESTPDPAERDAAKGRERNRVRPEFNSLRYGAASYCQLAENCAAEITSGASDESEMGAFHDLFAPQRAANLRARINEYVPAGMDAGIIYAS